MLDILLDIDGLLLTEWIEHLQTFFAALSNTENASVSSSWIYVRSLSTNLELGDRRVSPSHRLNIWDSLALPVLRTSVQANNELSITSSRGNAYRGLLLF